MEVKASLFEAFIGSLHAADTTGSYVGIKEFLAAVFTPILEGEYDRGRALNEAEVMQVNNFVDHVSLLNLWTQRGYGRTIV